MEGLDAYEYEGPQYRRLFASDGWRVAILNHGELFAEGGPKYIERHLGTDEVFVLLEGSAVLMIGENVERVRLERGRIYNVHRGVWHQVETMPGTKLLIVENDDTGPENSEKRFLQRSEGM